MFEDFDAGHHLNHLSLEALAAARSIGVEICLTSGDRNEPLPATAASTGVEFRLLP
jgi:hypothetical protein